MIKLDNINVYNFENALRGMRNPLESWKKGDTLPADLAEGNMCHIGPNDLGLAQRLIKGGAEHAKFLRQIFVSVDITAPLFWWKEADTYKIGTTVNSTSTMHKLATTPITKDCFSFDVDIAEEFYQRHINDCEELRLKYLETKDKKYWRALIQLLGNGWNQTRTWTGTYANLRNMVHQRENHKLIEWHDFIGEIEKLPYAKELIFYKGE